jgi:hypothetical protein
MKSVGTLRVSEKFYHPGGGTEEIKRGAISSLKSLNGFPRSTLWRNRMITGYTTKVIAGFFAAKA